MIIYAPDVPRIVSPSLEINGNSPLIGWRNVVTLDALTASSETTDNPAANLTVPSTYARWEASAAADQTLTVTLNSANPVDYIAIAGHNLGSAGITVAVETDTGSGYSAYVPATTVDNDGPLIIQLAPKYLTGIKVKLATGSAAPYISTFYVGRLLKLQRRIYVGHSPLSLNVNDEVTIGRSERGHFLGRVILSSTAQGSINLQNLSPDWVREHLMPWRRAGRDQPFFFAWRPHKYPDEVALCWFANNPSISNQRTNGMMQFSANIGGITRDDYDDE